MPRGELDAIVLKASRRDPQLRYATAEALADDIERYLRGERVLAQPDSLAYRLRKVLRRHWLGVTASAAVLAAIVVGFASTLALYFQVQRARADTEAQFAHLAHDLGVIRREAIRLALQRAGDDTTLAEPAFDVFFDARHQVDLFADALPALEVPGVRAAFAEGDQAQVDFEAATVTNLRTGLCLSGTRWPPVLLKALLAGGLVERLEAEGLVVREDHPTDRRAFLVRLTPAGRRQFRRMAAVHETWIVDLFDGWSPAQKAQVHGLLAGLKQHLAALELPSVPKSKR